MKIISDIVTHSSDQLIILKLHETYIDIIARPFVMEGMGSWVSPNSVMWTQFLSWLTCGKWRCVPMDNFSVHSYDKNIHLYPSEIIIGTQNKYKHLNFIYQRF
jgi:hypothetical protein